QVRHDLAGPGVRVDPGAEEAGRRRWRESVEDGEGGTPLAVMGSTTGHRTDASRRTVGWADDRPADRARHRPAHPDPWRAAGRAGIGPTHRGRPPRDRRRQARARMALAPE